MAERVYMVQVPRTNFFVSVTPLKINQVVKFFPGNEAVVIFTENGCDLVRERKGRVVWSYEHVLEFPEWAVLRQRFLLEDIKNRTTDRFLFKSGSQVIFLNCRTSADAYDYSALFHVPQIFLRTICRP